MSIFKRRFARLAFAATAVVALAMSGTTQVAWKGKPMVEPGSVKWPRGTMELINDPARTIGWQNWFSELPNDRYMFAFDFSAPSDLNRILETAIAIEASIDVIISPSKGAPKQSLGAGSAAVLSIGSQAILDQWYARIPKDASGEKKFGTQVYRAAPTVSPPMLTIYASHPSVDLAKLKVPAKARLSAAFTPEERKEFADTVEKIEAFVAARTKRSGSKTQ